MRTFYLISAVLGTLLPWSTFLPFLLDNGINPVSILAALYTNGATAGLSTDFFITCIVFWVFAWRDASQHNVPRWWIVIPAAPLIGLSMAMPTYLFLREGSIQQQEDI